MWFPGPAPSASPGFSLAVHIALPPHADPETLEVGTQHSVLKEARKWLMFENCCPTHCQTGWDGCLSAPKVQLVLSLFFFLFFLTSRTSFLPLHSFFMCAFWNHIHIPGQSHFLHEVLPNHSISQTVYSHSPDGTPPHSSSFFQPSLHVVPSWQYQHHWASARSTKSWLCPTY